MTRIFALTNQKGGTGKTTSVINIASYWARKSGENRVLVVDVDPQASATSVFLGVPMAAGPRQRNTPVMRDVLEGTVPVADAIYMAELPEAKGYPSSNIHILPSHADLAVIEATLNQDVDGLFRLAEAIDAIAHHYEMVLIDCPASLGTFTMSALLAATEVVIPVVPGKFELVGIGLLKEAIKKVQRPRLNPRLKISAILPTRITRTNLSDETVDSLKRSFGDMVLPEIPERVAIGEAHAIGEDIFTYRPQSDVADAYAKAIEALMRRTP